MKKSNSTSKKDTFPDGAFTALDDSDQTGRFELYKELRELNPSPYLYYYNFGDFEIIGSSPEMIVKQTDNRVYTCPIAGTRKRGKTPQEDTALEQELLADEKRACRTRYAGRPCKK